MCCSFYASFIYFAWSLNTNIFYRICKKEKQYLIDMTVPVHAKNSTEYSHKFKCSNKNGGCKTSM